MDEGDIKDFLDIHVKCTITDGHVEISMPQETGLINSIITDLGLEAASPAKHEKHAGTLTYATAA